MHHSDVGQPVTQETVHTELLAWQAGRDLPEVSRRVGDPWLPDLPSDRESVRARALANPSTARLWVLECSDWQPHHCVASGLLDAIRVLHHERGPNVAALAVGVFSVDPGGAARWDYPEVVPQSENARFAVGVALEAEVNAAAAAAGAGDFLFHVVPYAGGLYRVIVGAVPGRPSFIGSAAEVARACARYCATVAE